MSKSAAQQPEKPEWFVNRYYARLKGLDAEGWFPELMRLYELSVDYDLKLHSKHPNILIDGSTGRTTTTVYSVPPVQLFGPDDAGVCLPSDLLPAILVQIRAPEEIIFSELKRVLKKAQKRFGTFGAKPGPCELNGRFENTTFARWQSDQIVQWVDLLMWRATLPTQKKKKYSNRVFGEWLGLTEKQTKGMKKKLTKALDSLSAFAAQIPHDIWRKSQEP